MLTLSAGSFFGVFFSLRRFYMGEGEGEALSLFPFFSQKRLILRLRFLGLRFLGLENEYPGQNFG